MAVAPNAGGMGSVASVGNNDAASAVLTQLLSLIDANGLSPNGQAALMNFLTMQNRGGGGGGGGGNAGGGGGGSTPPQSLTSPSGLPLGLQAALNAASVGGIPPQSIPAAAAASVAGFAAAAANGLTAFSAPPSNNGAVLSAVLQQAAAASTAPPVQQFQESIQLQVKRMRFSSPHDAASASATPRPRRG